MADDDVVGVGRHYLAFLEVEHGDRYAPLSSRLSLILSSSVSGLQSLGPLAFGYSSGQKIYLVPQAIAISTSSLENACRWTTYHWGRLNIGDATAKTCQNGEVLHLCQRRRRSVLAGLLQTSRYLHLHLQTTSLHHRTTVGDNSF